MARSRSEDGQSYELSRRATSSDQDLPLYNTELDDDHDETQLLGNGEVAVKSQPSLLKSLSRYIPFVASRQRRALRRKQHQILRPSSLRRVLLFITGFTLATVLIVAIFFPSYTNPPSRYTELRKRVEGTDGLGAGNPNNEKIFIAASIFDKDGDLAGGKWGECMLRLVDILGPQNVYLSIYENDAGDVAEAALNALEKKVTCEHTLNYEKHLDLYEIEHVTMPDGTKRVRRMTYLSEARNRALSPIDSTGVTYDKLLYVNDVVFDPIEVAQLLFLTGVGEDSGQRASYRAACAVDFSSPLKYYDTFATRDYEGYGIGLPFFPWYTTAGQGVSRGEVLRGSDAVPVRSCWGGMVAFDARFFQASRKDVPKTAASEAPVKMTAPYRFRGEHDMYRDASECCLIHADIQDTDSTHSGIVVNPYVRTAYDWSTLRWLNSIRRIERLMTPVHWIITKAVGMPWYNPRRSQQPGQEVEEEVWVPDVGGGGSFKRTKRPASHDGFCGLKGMQLMKVDRSGGGLPWEPAIVPT